MMLISTGVDITEVSRIRKAAQKWGDDFLKRIFTKNELKNAKTKTSFYQHLAGRFAAKEAIFKAVGDNKLSWQDIQIDNDKEGKPICLFLNGRGKNITACISISHVKTYAVANAIVTKKS